MKAVGIAGLSLGAVSSAVQAAQSAATTAIALTDVVNNRVYQRDASSTSGPIFVSGTYTGGAPSAVQAQVIDAGTSAVVVPWTNVDTAPQGGNWLGFVNAPQGGPYRVQVRCANNTSLQASGTNSAYVGIVLLCYGQSNMAYMFGSGAMYASPDESIPAALTGTFVFDGTTWAAAPSNGIRVLMNELRTATGVPIGAMHGAVSGQSIGSLVPGQTLFNNFAATIAASGARGEFLVWHQGEGNAGTSTGTSAESYAASLGSIHQAVCDAVGRTKAQMPLILAGLGRTDSISFTDPPAWDAGQRMLMDAVGLMTNAHYSHANVDVTLFDGIHWTASGYIRAAKRYARTITTLLGLTTGKPDWRITSARVIDGTTTDVTVTHSIGNDYTPATGITGFEVSGDNGGTWSAATGVRVDATKIRLTHADVVTSNLRKIRYLYGTLPDITGLVKDNSVLAVPLTQSGGPITPIPLAAFPVTTVLSSGATNGAGATSSRTNVSIGAAQASRKLLVLGISTQSTANISSLVVTTDFGETVNATLVVRHGTTTGQGCHIYTAEVSGSATVASYALTFSANPFATPYIHCWSINVDDLQSTTPVGSTALAGNVSSFSSTLNTAANGCAIMVAAANTSVSTSGSTDTWVNRRSSGISGTQHHAWDTSGTSSNTSSSIVLTLGAAVKGAMAAVAFR